MKLTYLHCVDLEEKKKIKVGSEQWIWRIFTPLKRAESRQIHNFIHNFYSLISFTTKLGQKLVNLR